MRRSLFTAALVLLLGAGAARAQEPPPPPPRPEKPMKPEPPHGPGPEQQKELRKKIQAMRMARLTQELDLDEAAAAKLFPLVNRHDEKMDSLMEERGRAMKDMAIALHENKPDAIGPALDKLEAVEKSIHEADEATHKKVREILTPTQTAKFFLFHERFHEEVRDFIEGARGDEKRMRMAHDKEEKARAMAEGAGAKPLLEKARMFEKNGQLDDAIDLVNKAIELEPKNPGAYLMGAQLHAHKAELDEALGLVKQAMAIDPEAIDPHVLAAHISLMRKDLKAAQGHADWIAKKAPDAPQGYALRAVIAIQANKPEAAIDEASKAIELDPRDANLYRVRGDARAAKGDREGAVADYQRALQLDPKGMEAERTKKKINELSPK